ncbi:AAA family ATPase [Pedobacter montanisoli]|uniref:AAA family ATPase n=1 Tax=Pedobacter montanisoli TaxID=2923277 RepID=A0ABS9ZS36_9SPHI|nr:AAA family ATPase [Pedobacter montanisoli]MCJ0741392.1 AAA family ATPase [Pedobacter montanisoli]
MKSYWKLGCRWGSKSKGKPLFFDLLVKYGIVIGWENKDYQYGGNVLLTDGHTVLGVAKTTSLRKPVFDFPQYKEEFEELQIDYCEDLYVYNANIVKLPLDDRFLFKTQTGICGIDKQGIRQKMDSILVSHHNYFKKMLTIEKCTNLLKYKKQIILQGPPGTGKTKLAEEVAADLMLADDHIDDFEAPLTKEIILKYINVGLGFPSAKNIVHYTVNKITDTGISLLASTGKPYIPLFKEIIEAYKDKVWEKEGAITQGNDSYSAAIAKYIYLEQNLNKGKQEKLDQIKLVQFHPSYTYEDFVRGITSKPNEDGDGISYEAENKIIGAFAKKAFDNYTKSKKQNIPVEDLKVNFQRYIDHVIASLDESVDKKYPISDAIHIWYVDDKRFKYKGEDWKGHPNGLNMNFDQLEKILESNLTERSEINKLKSLKSLTRSHATYYANVVAKYNEFIKDNPVKTIPDEPLKNYILIIDEINRANLSSVLGELIYALEYRDKEVDSMYEVDGSNKITLPPNLYIIGTMNTADRSVGHIDYAIRRRFAFVDVLPENLATNNDLVFHSNLFKAVSELFVKDFDPQIKYTSDNAVNNDIYLSNEFEAKDVWLGHSYFIQVIKKDEKGKQLLIPENMELRLEYEIKPILMEYVKDGVLKPSAVEKIKNLTI